MTSLMPALEDFFGTIARVDAQAASDLLLDLLNDGTPLARITAEVLVPAQVRVGRRWQRGDWSVADEHAATAVTETALAALSQAAQARPAVDAGHAVLACAEGEWHTLPGRMVAAVAGTSDLRITVLGPSMPAEQLGRRLAAGDVDLLALSCTIPANLLGAARCIEAAQEHAVPVVVGGRAFGNSPERAYALGADAWSDDPAAALASIPSLAGRRREIPAEVLLLDAPDEGALTLTYERLVAAFPRLAGQSSYERARTTEDLRWMARFTAAAVLTEDRTVVIELLRWLCDLLTGRVPTAVITTSAHLLASTVEPFAPRGALLLHESADLVDQPGGSA